MNETPFEHPSNSEDELLPEYQFDYKKTKPNRFTHRSGKPEITNEQQITNNQQQTTKS